MKQTEFITPSSVILVSGGAKGITARCVMKLAQEYHCAFILLGRTAIDSPLPSWIDAASDEMSIKKHLLEEYLSQGIKKTPVQIQKEARAIQSQLEVQQTLQAVRNNGSQVQYLCIDVTDNNAMTENLAKAEKLFGPITGILHGAGNLADKLIENKSSVDFDSVFLPKVNGLENILNCIPSSQIQFLILFSSIVGFYGNRGQADYAMANEILNKTAYIIKRKHPSCRVVSIDWGPWETGMVTKELKAAFEASNIHTIPVDTGASILLKELTPSNGKNAQILVGDALPRNAIDIQGELKTHTIRRSLSLQANPFLRDHVIGDHPVLPATCAATWVVNACEQLYPGYSFFKLENFRVLKGIVFDDSLADEYVLELKETGKDDDGRITFHAVVWSRSGKAAKIRYHYKIDIELRRQMPASPLFENMQPTKDINMDSISGKLLYQNGTLFHGPSFQGVNQVRYISPKHLNGICMLPKLDAGHQGQFPVQSSNPFIYDAIVQYLLVWAQHYHAAPCLPSFMQSLEQYRPISFDQPCFVSMDIETQSDTKVRGNAVAYDEQGHILVKIDGMEGTISTGLNRYIGTTKQKEPVLKQNGVQEAITV